MKNNMIKKFCKIVIPIIISILSQNVCMIGAVYYEVIAINELANGRKNLESIVCVIVFYMLFIGVSLIYAILESKSIGLIRNDLYTLVWKKFFELGIKEHNQTESGNEINFMVTKVENVARYYYGGIIHIFANIIAYVMCFLMVLYSNPLVGCVCLLCTILLVFLGSRQSGKLMRKQEELQKILLVGESGIGKTTLFKAIMKQQEYSKGVIRIFGQKVDSLMEDSIFEHICYIEQNPVIFEGTILENIMLGNQKEDKDYAMAVF